MKDIKTALISASLISGLAVFMSGCSLEEFNPSEISMDTMAENPNSYQKIINQCYFGIERCFYAANSASGIENNNWMGVTEGDTDLWTSKRNKDTEHTAYFWYFAGAAPNTTYTDNFWSATYDGIGSCNVAISLAPKVSFQTEEERNQKVAEAHFLRAVYYFNAVEQFGGITVITEPTTEKNYHPERSTPMDIYENVIIPDLEFAAKWLPVGDNSTTTIPTRKAAMGFLCKAYLQTVEYDNSKKYAEKALNVSKELINDLENGGGKYNIHMYENYDDIFAQENNYNNKEALWKHRWVANSTGHGSSSGNYRLNRNVEYFYCDVFQFGGIVDNQERRLTWGGNPTGIFMPTQHLLSLFVQKDGTLDPRFHSIFQTEWTANIDYTWDKGSVNKYDKAANIEGETVSLGETAIRFVMPQEEEYNKLVQEKHNSKYLIIDYKDVYNDNAKNVKMNYAYVNPSEGYPSDGSSENLFSHFYPSLTKHNSNNYYVADAGKKRNGNLNATFIMRSPEIYLIAAEADIYVNGGSNAMGYINKVRNRAGANPLTGNADIRTVLDERARELCGEYCRFYDLKRTGMLKDDSYLRDTHPDLAKYFSPDYAVRPIPSSFTQNLEGGGQYYQNKGY